MNRCGFGPCGGAHLVGGGGGAGWLAVLDSIALWILAVAAILFLLGLRRRSRHWGRNGGRGGASYGPGRQTGWSQTGPAHHPQAEANLADRFSRGEITAEEYRTGIDVLRGQSHGQPQAQAYGQYPAQPSGSVTAQPRPAEPVQPEPPAGPTDPTV